MIPNIDLLWTNYSAVIIMKDCKQFIYKKYFMKLGQEYFNYFILKIETPFKFLFNQKLNLHC